MFDHIGPNDPFGSVTDGDSVYDYIHQRFVRHYQHSSEVKARHLYMIQNMLNMSAMRLPSDTARSVYDRLLECADVLIDSSFPSE
jgi:hypothetical protein